MVRVRREQSADGQAVLLGAFRPYLEFVNSFLATNAAGTKIAGVSVRGVSYEPDSIHATSFDHSFSLPMYDTDALISNEVSRKWVQSLYLPSDSRPLSSIGLVESAPSSITCCDSSTCSYFSFRTENMLSRERKCLGKQLGRNYEQLWPSSASFRRHLPHLQLQLAPATYAELHHTASAPSAMMLLLRMSGSAAMLVPRSRAQHALATLLKPCSVFNLTRSTLAMLHLPCYAKHEVSPCPKSAQANVQYWI